MPPRVPDDPTIHVGLRLYDGTDFDTVVERVEYGGFGVIAFGPNRERDGQMTAYKTLRRELLEDAQTRASFVRECLLWASLWTHPNVAQAYGALEMGDAQGQRPFLALAYADYGSLRTLLRSARQQPNGRVSLETGLYLAQQIAAGLAYLHTPDPTYLRYEPTVHRDLKPENVLLMEGGRAVITDFGLAKAVESSPVALALLLAHSSMGLPGQKGQQAEEVVLVGGEQATQTTGLHTQAGMALGTMAYMASEQWQDARYVGPAADIYALGIMLSEILAGRHALLDLEQPQTQISWRQAHLNPHPRPLRAVAPEVPEVVEAMYLRCVSFDPVARPSASEVLAALQAGARAAGVQVYAPFELAPHTPHNEFAYWQRGSIANLNFDLCDEALKRSERALVVARQLVTTEPDLLPSVLMTRGNILKELGSQALRRAEQAERQGNPTEAQRQIAGATEWDRQAEVAYQESLATRPPATTAEGSRGRAYVWNQIGSLNSSRKRFAHAEEAYARALKLQPDMADTYFNRALNQAQWGADEATASRYSIAIEHLRQARVHAVTSLGLGDPTARGLLQNIESLIEQIETLAQE